MSAGKPPVIHVLLESIGVATLLVGGGWVIWLFPTWRPWLHAHTCAARYTIDEEFPCSCWRAKLHRRLHR